MAELRLRALRGVACAVLAACGGVAPGPPPYGFDVAPEQPFRMEAEDETTVDGTPVRIQRLADFRLVVDEAARSRYEIALVLERWYLRVEGAPGGTTEILISEDGFHTRGTPEGEMFVGPDERGPGGATPRTLLSKPIGGFITTTSGEVAGEPWTSFDPLLAGVHVLDWVVLGFPVQGGPEGRWSGSRALPAIGQYEFGIDLPVRYERASEGGPADGARVRATGATRRSGLEVAAGLSGDVRFEYAAETDVDASGRVRRSRLELRLDFDGDGGEEVSSIHRVTIRCRECSGPAINPARGDSDTGEG